MRKRIRPLELEDFEFALISGFEDEGDEIIQKKFKEELYGVGLIVDKGKIEKAYINNEKLIPIYDSLFLPKIDLSQAEKYRERLSEAIFIAKDFDQIIREVRTYMLNILKSFPVVPCWRDKIDGIAVRWETDDDIDFRWKEFEDVDAKGEIKLNDKNSFTVIFNKIAFIEEGPKLIFTILNTLIDHLILNQPTSPYCHGFFRRLNFLGRLCGAIKYN